MPGIHLSLCITRLFIENSFMQKMYLCLAGKMNFIKLILVLLIMEVGGKGMSQVSTWDDANINTEWYKPGNWNPNTNFNAWNITHTALFNNTGMAVTAGINMGSNPLSIGAIELSVLRLRPLTVGNSSPTISPLTLNGITVNGIANTILRNASGSDLTIQDNETGSGKIMGIVLANITNNIINVDGSGSITIGCIMSGNNPLTKSGVGVGVLNLTAPNTYTGTTTINNGILQLNNVGGNTIPVTNNVVINGGTLNINTSQILSNLNINSGALNIAAGITLTINGSLNYNGGIINGPGTIIYGPSGKLIYNASKITGIEWTNSNLPTAVTLNNAAVVTLGSNASTSGNLAINNTSNLTGTSFTLTVAGDWNSASTNSSTGYSAGNSATSIVVFNGTGTKSITHVGGVRFKNMNISGTGYYTANSNIEISAYTLNISNGTLDMLTNTLDGTGNLTMSDGLLKLAKLNTILPELTGNYSLTGGTIELYGALGLQILKSGITSYKNLTFSGSSTTTLSSSATTPVIGNVYITGNAIFDASNYTFGSATTNLIMDGGKYRVSGVGSKPDINGNFTLTGGVMEYYNSGTVGNETIKGISSISNPIIFNQIEVTGNKVGQGASNITLGNVGSFSVKSSGIYETNDGAIVGPTGNQTVTVETGGTFKTGDVNGFAGGTATSIKNDIENVVLQTGSTVEYSKATGVGQIITKNGVTNPSTGNYYNLTLSGTGTKTAPSSILSILGNLTKLSTCFFSHNTGTVSIDGTSATTQFYTSTIPVMEFCKLINNNTIGGFTINGDLGVDSMLTLSNNSKLIFGTGDVNIRSGPIRTGSVGLMIPATAALIDYTGSGRFQIERYLYQKKAWRLLATPVDITSSPSITNSWRESGFNTITGYGTQITGPISSLGMDTITQRGSMKWFDTTLQNYKEITNTSGVIARTEGYYVFVRGDRSQTPTGIGNATNLRIKGKILTGNQTFKTPLQVLPTGTDGYASVGNPYASQINFKTVVKNNIDPSFTVWNPNGGYYGVGRFIQYTSPTLNGDYANGGTTINTIESGQAFFLQSAIGVSGSITIQESDKLSGSILVSRTETSGRNNVLNPTLEINLHDVNSSANASFQDQTIINFDNRYSNDFDRNDVRKFMNSNDNLAIKLGNRNIILERRNTLTPTDTIFLSLTNTRIAPYRFEIDPSILGNLPLNAFLKDKFLGIDIPVSLTNVTNVNFSITNDVASRVADRFMIVFKQATPNGQLTGNFISIAVDKNADKANVLKWSYSNELNIAQYSVERSKNGTAFTGVGNQNAENERTTKSYLFTDITNGSGTNYYRVKATSTTGQVQYSNTVKIVDSNINPVIAVRPNPIVNKTMCISFDNLVGNYTLKLISKQGATVYKAQITVSFIKEVKNIAIGNGVAAGLYDLVLVNKAGKSLIQKVFVQ